LRSFQKHLPEFEARNVQLVAASVDPPEVTREHTEKMGFTYRFLCDPEAAAIKQLDLLHEDGGMEAPDIARPAEFLIDPNGTVRWVNLTENWRIRQRPEDILHIIDEIAALP
jgi:peroxiredoxin